MANPLINFFRRIVPGWFRIRHTRLLQAQYFRQQDYWQANSIYLDNIFNKISTDVAMLKFKHVRITRNEGAPDEMQWFEFSDLAQALTISPNDNESPIVFWSSVVRKMLHDGVAVVIPKVINDTLQELRLVQGVLEFNEGKLLVQLDKDAKEQVIEIDITSCWIFENPKQNISAQLGQITRLIDDNLRSLSWKLSDKNSKLDGFLKLDTKAEDGELKKRAEMRVKNIMDVAENGGIGFLQKGEDFMELSKTYGTASEAELEFLKLQLYQAFGINEKLFTCDYTEMQYRAYFQGVLKVYQRVISEEINRKWFSRTARTQGHRLLTYFDMVDIVSLKDVSEFVFKAKYTGLMNSNELREMFFGLGGYSGGDVYETNLNQVQIGQPNNEGGGTNGN
jgi:phage portal protein BeeE